MTDQPTPPITPPNVQRLQAHTSALVATVRALFSLTSEGDVIQAALGHLRGALEASAVLLAENVSDPHDGLCLRQTHTDHTPDIAPDRGPWAQLAYRAGFERWRTLLSRSQVIRGAVRSFPASERTTLEARGIQSLLVLPVFIEGQWYGLLAFTDHVTARDWTSDEIDLAQTGASLLADYLTDQRRLAAMQQVQTDLEQRVVERTAALQASEARAQSLLQAIPDALYRLDGLGAFLDYKPPEGSTGVAGPLGKQWRNSSIHKQLPAAVAADVQQAINHVLKTGKPQALEYQAPGTLPGVELRDYEARIAPIGASEVLAIVRDITARKRTEAALRSVNETLIRQTTDLERRSTQLQAAVEITRDITTSSVQSQTILSEAVEQIQQRFGLYQSSIFLIDQNQHAATLEATTGMAARTLQRRRFHVLFPNDRLLGRMANTGRSELTTAVGRESVFAFELDLKQARSELAVPMRTGARLIGALVLQATQPDSFAADDITIYQLLADQLAYAVENSRLIEQNQQALQELQQRYAEQTDENWRKRVQLQQLAFHYTPAGEVIPDNDNGDGAPPQTLAERERAFAVQNESTGQVLKARITLRGQTLGAITLRRTDDQPDWTDEEHRLVGDVAEQVALALENARLVAETRDALSETQRLAQRDRAIAQVTDRIHQELDLQSILEVATAELRRVTGRKRVVVRLQPPATEGDDAP